jgi:hypothetical protein
MTDQGGVAYVALWMAGISFALYAIEAVLTWIRNPAAAMGDAVTKAAAATQRAEAPSIDQIAKLIEALSKLTDSLTKASPSLVSLVGAIFFLAIAAYTVHPVAAPSQPAAQERSAAIDPPTKQPVPRQ